jgi:hypothetical protein
MTSLDEKFTGDLTSSFLRKPVQIPAFRLKLTNKLTLSIVPCSDICTTILMILDNPTDECHWHVTNYNIVHCPFFFYN